METVFFFYIKEKHTGLWIQCGPYGKLKDLLDVQQLIIDVHGAEEMRWAECVVLDGKWTSLRQLNTLENEDIDFKNLQIMR